MSKNSRSQQSRLNGAKFRGPVTEKGKAASSQNAFQHGFYASRVRLLEWEKLEDFDYLRASYMRRFQPADEVEADRIDQMVDSVWRRRRPVMMETTLLDLEIAAGAKAVEDLVENSDGCLRIALAFQAKHGDGTLSMLQRHLTAAERSFSRALHELKFLQGARFNQNPEPPPPDGEDIEVFSEQTRQPAPQSPAPAKSPSPNTPPEKIAA